MKYGKNRGTRFMKKLFFGLYIKILVVFPLKKSRLTILETSFPSGSNTRILYNYIMDSESSKFPYEVLYIDLKSRGILNKMKSMYLISTSNVIVASHGFQKLRKRQFLVNLWHGTPLKSMNFMDKSISSKKKFSDNLLITNSKMESVLLGSCMQISFDNHEIIGNPRLDYLTNPQSINNQIISRLESYDKVLIYLPTFRHNKNGGTDGHFYGNLFNFLEFDYTYFTDYLEKNNILLITKYHQNELAVVSNKMSNSSNIMTLTDLDLISNDIDLYQLLPYTDLLITDYSSVYIDYLITDKPILFTPTDLEEYSNTRGLLLEPYDFWTPGPKVSTIDEMIDSLDAILLDSGSHLSKDYDKMKLIFHPNSTSKNNVVELFFRLKSIMERTNS